MNQASDFDRLSDEQLLMLDRLASEFEAAWKSGERPGVESRLANVADDLRAAALAELLPVEIAYRRRAGEAVSADELARRFPDASPPWLRELAVGEADFGGSRSDAAPAGGERAGQGSSPGDAADDSEEVLERFGDYRILSRIGGGGMGTVYKAVHERMGRVVALKVLRSDFRDDARLLQRFDREVRAAARLSHPNIVTALDAREHLGRHCLITEFVDGCDLQETVRQHGPLPRGLAVDCISQVARGLAYAHRQGVIHRDIKPANLLLGVDGTVKILDMGLARFESPDEPASHELTKSGVVMGTAAYMAPEQARDTRRADARSDLYSLGCTLYFLIHGRPPFSGETMVDTILSHVSQPAPSLGTADEVPPGLEAAFRRLVAKDPADRFASADELLAALEPYRSDDSAAVAIDLHDVDERFAKSQGQELRDSAAPTATLPERFETRNAPSVVAPPVAVAAPAAVENGGVAVVPPQLAPPAPPRERNLPPSEADRWPPIVTTSVQPPAAQTRRPTSPTRRLVAISLVAAALVTVLGYGAIQGWRRQVEVAPTGDDFAIELNGTSSYVMAPSIVPGAERTYTIEAIVRPSRFQTSNVVSWLGPDWMALYVSDDGRWGAARRWRGEPHLVASRQTATPGTTVHVAAVFHEEQLQVWVDGRLAETDAVSHPMAETSGGLYIGGVPFERLPENRYFAGQIDAVRISLGRRYTASFSPPKTLSSDAETVCCFPFGEGRGPTTRSTDSNGWEATLVETTWHSNGAP